MKSLGDYESGDLMRELRKRGYSLLKFRATDRQEEVFGVESWTLERFACIGSFDNASVYEIKLVSNLDDVNNMRVSVPGVKHPMFVPMDFLERYRSWIETSFNGRTIDQVRSAGGMDIFDATCMVSHTIRFNPTVMEKDPYMLKTHFEKVLKDWRDGV